VRRFWFVRYYLEMVSRWTGRSSFTHGMGFVTLPRAIEGAGHAHNDRWLLRELKAPREAM
jgi:hypothetical protein